MKKKTMFLSLVATLVLLAGLFAGCTKLEPGDATILYNPSEMEIVRKLDAFNVINEAYENYRNCNKYCMEIDFVFNTSVGSTAYQSSYQKIVRNGNMFHDFYMVAGKGLGDKRHLHDFYYEGATGGVQGGKVKAIYSKDKKVISLDKNDKVQANYKDLTYGGFDPLQEVGNVKTPLDRVNKMKYSLNQYYCGKEIYLSNKMDRQVYKNGDKYYCTMIINTTTMNRGDGNYQDKVVSAIESSTGGKLKEFKDDTRMVCELIKIDGKFYFTQYILMEDYTGDHGIIKIDVQQQYWYKFAYDDASTKIVMPK